MRAKKPADAAGLVARIVRECVREGAAVEIDGIGRFAPSRKGGLGFQPQTRPRVFLAYGEEDLAAVRRLASALRSRGFDPWVDKVKLLPGQNWPRAIENAIEATDFFIGCFSCSSVSKRGTFQGELRFALECARRMPLDEVFLIPVRLDECEVPPRIRRAIQYVDLFPNWDAGLKKLERVLWAESRQRNRRRLRLVC